MKLPLSMAAEMLATFCASNSAPMPVVSKFEAVLDSASFALASLAGGFAATVAAAVAAPEAARVASLGACAPVLTGLGAGVG